MRKPEVNPVTDYIHQVFAREDLALRNVRSRLREHGREGINIGPSEGKLLQVLMHMNGIKKVVEVGTLFGYSAVWMARALPVVGHIYTIEKDPLSAQNARQSFLECGVAEQITLCEGDSASQLALLESHGPFDMIFIDANKSGYVEVLNWARRHVRAGGLIVGDNTLLFGTVCSEQKPEGVSNSQWSVMREFNQQLANPKEFTSVMIPTAEGLTIAIKL